MNTLLEITRKLVTDLQRIGFGDPHVPINGAQCVDVVNDHYADLAAAFESEAHPTPAPGAASRTTAKPTVPGWYWFWQQNSPGHKAEPEVVRMYQDGGGRLRFAESSVLATDTPQWCEWSGPILPGGAS